MESQKPENFLADMKILIKELNRGQEFAYKLREVMLKKPLENGSRNKLAEDLLGKIMDSFCNTLSIINTTKSNELVSQVSVEALLTCTSSLKDGRGSNKNRKISVKNVEETSTFVEDGHVWRKYGQKRILDGPYPRCTHKFDQGCEATKQEQRIQANPPRFRTIYQGQHTCKTYPTVSQILLDSQTDHEDSSFLLSFDSNVNYDHLYFPTFPSTKKEIKEEVSPGCFNPNQHQFQSSSSDYFLPSDDYSTPAAEVFGQVKASLSSGSDNGNFLSSGSVYSSSYTSTDHAMEMDMMVGSIDFEDLPYQFKW